MRLTVHEFAVRGARLGEATRYRDGVLTVDGPTLAAELAADRRFARVEVAVASPGDPVRIVNVLDLCEPRVKAEPPQEYFPGMLGALARAGTGTTHALTGCAVLEIGTAPGFFGGLVDMTGPGAELSLHARTHNVCLVTEPAAGVTPREYGLALKRAGLAASVRLARATLGQTPDAVKAFDLDIASRANRRPRVAYLMQLHSHGDSREPFVYGDHPRHWYPTLLHPNEVLDGAVVCGHYDIAMALKNSTYTLLNHPIIRDLYARHGAELDFRGVVIAPEPTALADIRRTAMMSATLLSAVLGAEGVVLTKEGGGHTDVDLMENCEACEAAGIRTVIIDNEWLGLEGVGELPLLARSPRADALVSVGNVDELVELPALERLIGGEEHAELGSAVRTRAAIPVRLFPNAISQAGLTRLRAEAR